MAFRPVMSAPSIMSPVVDINDYVLLLTSTGNVPAQVTWIEPFPYYVKDFGAITDGTTTSDTEISDVYLEDYEFGQFRVAVKTTGLEITKHSSPKAVPYWTLKNQAGLLIDDAAYNDYLGVEYEHLTEFYQYQDTGRYMQVKNNSGADVTNSYVVFFGYVFQFKELGEMPEKTEYKAIPCSAKPTIR